MQLHLQPVSLTLNSNGKFTWSQFCNFFICDELAFGFGVMHFALCCLKTRVHKEYRLNFSITQVCKAILIQIKDVTMYKSAYFCANCILKRSGVCMQKNNVYTVVKH